MPQYFKDYIMYEIGQYVRHIRSGSIGRINRVDNKFGSLTVKFIVPHKFVRHYALTDQLHRSLYIMQPDEVADFRLAMENHGITSSWKE